jgi:hypothetical protein
MLEAFPRSKCVHKAVEPAPLLSDWTAAAGTRLHGFGCTSWQPPRPKTQPRPGRADRAAGKRLQWHRSGPVVSGSRHGYSCSSALKRSDRQHLATLSAECCNASALPYLPHPCGGFCSAGTPHHDSCRSEHRDRDGTGEAVAVAVQRNGAVYVVGAGKASVRVKAKELKGAVEHPAAPAFPSAEPRAVTSGRLAISVRQRSAGLEHIQRLKRTCRRALTIRDGHLRQPDAFDDLNTPALVPGISSGSRRFSQNGWRLRAGCRKARRVPQQSSHRREQRHCRYFLQESQVHTAPAFFRVRRMRNAREDSITCGRRVFRGSLKFLENS